MGIGPTALLLYLDLASHGHLHSGQSVCELGAQDMMPEDFDMKMIYHAFEALPLMFCPDSSRQLMNYLGFDYECVDLDGKHGALKIDLNHAKFHNDQLVTYDVITNHGTSEHIFNQANCFGIIHNLCKPGGYMIHINPHHGEEQKTHGLYCYTTNFYDDLANANRYEIVRHYVNQYKPGAGYSVIAVLKKLYEQAFVMPIQGCYSYLETKEIVAMDKIVITGKK